MNKILSVVVPTYNMEKYLDRCLSSLIVNEDHKGLLEVLVVNDGSKDRSSEIAHGYADRYPDVYKVIDKENGNYGSCINTALPIATGKYVKVLDADDWFENGNLADFLNFLLETDADLVISHTYDRNIAGDVMHEVAFPNIPDMTFDIQDTDYEEIRHLFIHFITYRLDILREMDYKQLEHISYTDLQWSTEPMIKVRTAVCFHKVVYNYFIGREGQTIDAAVHCRNMWMEEKVILHIVGLYEREYNELTGYQRTFLKSRIVELINKVYDYYLREHVGLLTDEGLSAFDGRLRILSPQIYNFVDDLVINGFFFRFHYIRDWRKNQNRKTVMFFLFDAYRRICSMVKRN